MAKIGILGAGAWGTALACAMVRAGHDVLLYARDEGLAGDINRTHENGRYLPSLSLPPEVVATGALQEAVQADIILLVTPAQHIRTLCRKIKDIVPEAPVFLCSKGIEQNSMKLMSEVVAEELPRVRQGVLSGPTFASEVARDMPSACTLAMDDLPEAMALVEQLSSPYFRLYGSDDIMGAEIGGAVKNVLAIASGMLQGLGFGDNARAALITRGIAEMARLGEAKGGRLDTLMGLAGMGDLILTCNSLKSRNFSLGVALGRGEKLEDILARRRTVAEGSHTAQAVCDLADFLSVEMPLCHSVNMIINHGGHMPVIVRDLLARPLKEESPYTF